MKNFGWKVLGGGMVLFVIGYAFALPTNANGKLNRAVQNNGCCEAPKLKPISAMDLNFYVGGKHDRTITTMELSLATQLSDIIPNYPSSWMDRYESVNITVKGNGFSKTETSMTPELTESQREILNNLSINSEVLIQVDYGVKNSITNKMESHQMLTDFTVVPSKSAFFGSSKRELSNYLRLQLTPGILGEEELSAEIHFRVNKLGDTEKVNLVYQKGSTMLADAYVKIVEDMPNWHPAVNEMGEPVIQDFVLVVGNRGC